MTKFEIIVALDSELGIGLKGSIPWRISADLKHFREITTTTQDPLKQNAVIMGRKTWDSLPDSFRPLPKRFNVVISRRNQSSFPSDVTIFNQFDKAIEFLSEYQQSEKIDKIFVIGGAEIYKYALVQPNCEKIHVTHIQYSFNCDTFFSEFDSFYQLESKSETLVENEKAFYFATYSR